ncbi:hypothetical protein [Thioalkalivibrio halophilus]|uniref:Uncharacterized protein n=1 Tax=Thioalkalivibrio halophilus TaxID=252474 RepID=A0A1V3A1G4_9GAMM|nr:hypothetical protein [Thioalkalivibrio halophilus]OOC11175.1 hypothetical protein B1A74_01940 [Thioalkalivibrio halophilus]
MSLRLRKRWKQDERPRTTEDIASAAASNAWRTACNGVLNLENADFETRTQEQRLQLIQEFAIFLLHLTDRRLGERLSQEERGRLITAMALRLAAILEENVAELRAGPDRIPGPVDGVREAFVNRINRRSDEYAECRYDIDEGPGFSLWRAFAVHVSEALGPHNRQWAIDQVMATEGPEAVEAFVPALESLLPSAAGAGADP